MNIAFSDGVTVTQTGTYTSNGQITGTFVNHSGGQTGTWQAART